MRHQLQSYGNLSLSIRPNGSSQDWVQIFNLSVNGTFSIQHFLNSADAQIRAGITEIQLRFFPDAIEATDDANLTAGGPYLLRGLLEFSIQSNSQLRGFDAVVVVTMNDHRGEISDLSASGNFDFIFNGTWVNTTVDPESETLA